MASSFEEMRALLAPYDHLNSTPSKGVRGLFIDAFNQWFGLCDDVTEKIKAIVAKLHTSSLLIDDIEDGSAVRRGQPAAHCVFGEARTINCANQQYFHALADIAQLAHWAHGECDEQKSGAEPGTSAIYSLVSSSAHTPEEAAAHLQLVQVYTEEMVQLHIGQGQDILWRELLQCPSLEEYELMVLRKTGGLFRIAAKLMMVMALHDPRTKADGKQFVSTHEKALLALINHFSLLFQVLDDWSNLMSAKYFASKTFCEDITEGKFSFPVVHSIITARKRAHGSETPLLHVLRQRTTDESIKRFALTLLEETDSLNFTRDYILKLKARIEDELNGDLKDNSTLLRCLHHLCVPLAEKV